LNIPLSLILDEGRKAGLPLDCAPAADRAVTGIAPLQDCGPGDLVFLDHRDFIEGVLARGPSVIVTSPKFRDALAGVGPGTTLVFTPNVALAHAWIRQRHAGRDFDAAGWDGPIHPSAVVHPTAVIDPTARVEPRAVIGRHTRIGARCRIMAGAIIEHDVTIGPDSVVHPCAVIGYGSRLGAEVVIGPGSVVGSEGFGFAQDASQRSHPIPQTGIVVIGDRVRVGANNCIDRATFATSRTTCRSARTAC
jgi:UDP-3-O-[3-hydroxymyristoyl] glucosamine N-acyltransferase